MIAKIINCASHHRLVDYLLQSPRSRDPSIIDSTIGYTPRDMKTDLDHLTAANTRIRKPIMHVVVAWHPDDKVTNSQMATVGSRLMRGMGYDMDKGGYAIVRHDDEAHPHMHIIASKVYGDGTHFADKGFPGRRLREAANRLEQELDFVPAVPLDERSAIHQRKRGTVAPHDIPSEDDPQLDSLTFIGNRIPVARPIPDDAEMELPVHAPELKSDLRLTNLEARTGVRPLKIAVYEAITKAIDRSDGTFESLDEELERDGLVAPAWSFNGKGEFNGASFTPLNPMTGDPLTDQHGQPYAWKGSQLGPRGGLNKNNLNQRLERQSQRLEAERARAERRRMAAVDRSHARLFLAAARMLRSSGSRGFHSGRYFHHRGSSSLQIRRILRMMDDRRQRQSFIPSLSILRPRRR